PIVAGRNISWVGRTDVPRSFSFLPDIARGLVDLGENPAALGRPWHIPPAPPITAAEFFGLAYRTAGTSGQVKPTRRLILRLASRFNS
ncbi:hypothetical protein NL529_29815, partial [Klebsiella pneumoniae]|nr:hypothetical protein [Klebsiella pneumoniae]